MVVQATVLVILWSLSYPACQLPVEGSREPYGQKESVPTDSLLELVFTAGECANRFTAGVSVHSRRVC